VCACVRAHLQTLLRKNISQPRLRFYFYNYLSHVSACGPEVHGVSRAGILWTEAQFNCAEQLNCKLVTNKTDVVLQS
jgi:hypothetical protein